MRLDSINQRRHHILFEGLVVSARRGVVEQANIGRKEFKKKK